MFVQSSQTFLKVFLYFLQSLWNTLCRLLEDPGEEIFTIFVEFELEKHPFQPLFFLAPWIFFDARIFLVCTI